jgi:hypothetical protein
MATEKLIDQLGKGIWTFKNSKLGKGIIFFKIINPSHHNSNKSIITTSIARYENAYMLNCDLSYTLYIPSSKQLPSTNKGKPQLYNR